MAEVRYSEATRWYDLDAPPALDRLDLMIEDGEFMVLVGPSGSGKSTALRLPAGLEPLDEGSIHIGTKDVSDLEPKARDIAMVFQNYALYPHMTVFGNIAFALALARLPKAEVRRRVEEAARVLELEPYLDRRPKELSGGQRQRVAMGRAIVREPQVFLMDEPLSNLDAKLRVQTRTQIAALQQRLGITTVYVTHDQTEAMTMGDRVAVLHHGVLQQVASPRELYARPANSFVAGFIGSPAMNLLEVPLHEHGARVGPALVPVPRTARDGAGKDTVVVGIRPEAFELASTADDGAIALTTILVEELGADAFVHGATDTGVRLVVRVDCQRIPAKGETLHVRPRVHECHLFRVDDGYRL
jgi:multiple sugar transport system ATP-binding protein